MNGTQITWSEKQQRRYTMALVDYLQKTEDSLSTEEKDRLAGEIEAMKTRLAMMITFRDYKLNYRIIKSLSTLAPSAGHLKVMKLLISLSILKYEYRPFTRIEVIMATAQVTRNEATDMLSNLRSIGALSHLHFTSRKEVVHFVVSPEFIETKQPEKTEAIYEQ